MPQTKHTPNLDHPTLKLVNDAFPSATLQATEYRGQTTLILKPDEAHEVLSFLRSNDSTGYDFLSDVYGVDYHEYPSETPGRFAVGYNLVNTATADRFFVKVFVSPTIDTSGIDADPALEVDSVCDIWPGAEWNEREVYDMFGIRFRNHPDLRRILTWEEYPGHPLRKDYPLRGRGEREHFKVVDRSDA